MLVGLISSANKLILNYLYKIMEPIDYSKDGLFKSKVSEARQPISIAKGLCEEETDDLELCQRMYGLNDYKCKGKLSSISAV